MLVWGHAFIYTLRHSDVFVPSAIRVLNQSLVDTKRPYQPHTDSHFISIFDFPFRTSTFAALLESFSHILVYSHNYQNSIYFIAQLSFYYSIILLYIFLSLWVAKEFHCRKKLAAHPGSPHWPYYVFVVTSLWLSPPVHPLGASHPSL